MRAFSFPMCCVFAEGDFRAPVRRTKPASRVAFRDSARMHLRCGGEAGAAKGRNYGECGGCARTRGWWHCSSARAGYYLRRSVAVTYPRVVGLLPSPPCCLFLCIFFSFARFIVLALPRPLTTVACAASSLLHASVLSLMHGVLFVSFRQRSRSLSRYLSSVLTASWLGCGSRVTFLLPRESRFSSVRIGDPDSPGPPVRLRLASVGPVL